MSEINLPFQLEENFCPKCHGRYVYMGTAKPLKDSSAIKGFWLFCPRCKITVGSMFHAKRTGLDKIDFRLPENPEFKRADKGD